MKEKSKTNKISWLSVLQGWSMLLVVIGHVTLSNTFMDPEYPVSAWIEKTIYSFHMPLFMFISGFLFNHTKIKRLKGYSETLKDKLNRLGIPYLFFTLMTLGLKYLFNPFMKRPVELSLSQFINSFLYPDTNPLGEMWFVATLLVLFTFYPLFKCSLQHTHYIVATLLFFMILNHYNEKFTDFLALSRVTYFLVFFYCGILFSQYNGITFLSRKWLIPVSGIFFIASILWGEVSSLMAFSGILFSLCTCAILSKRFPSLFASFRDYTFQIFLLGIFFQMGIRFLYARFPYSELYVPFYLLSIGGGIYIPVFISKVLQKSKSKLLLRCFGL